MSLSNPASTPGSGTCTVRYRIARTNNGTVDGGGSACTVTGEVYQGANIVATDVARTASGSWTTYSYTFPTSLVSDWTDLRFRATTSTSGGSPANRRGGAVSWMELEVPDAAAAQDFPQTIPVTGSGAAALARVLALLRAISVSGAGTATLSRTVARSVAIGVTGAGSPDMGFGFGVSQSVAVTGAGTAAFAESLGFARAISALGAGSATLTRSLAFVELVQATGAGVMALLRGITKRLTVLGAGTASVAGEGSGGGPAPGRRIPPFRARGHRTSRRR